MAPGVGGRLTVPFKGAEESSPHSGPGSCVSNRGESPYRGTETTQPLGKAMMDLILRSPKGCVETAPVPE